MVSCGKSAFAIIPLVLVLLAQESSARGRPFRFKFLPERLSNLAYSYGSSHRSPQRLSYFQDPADNYLQNLMEEDEGEEACYKKKCSANENCCEGSVCVEIDGVEGECLPADGRSEGERCIRDEDCEVGLFCEREHKSGGKFCQSSGSRKKLFNEDCDMSVDCDIEKGLCCQLQRRIRQRAKKVCNYFSDPMQCIGPVAVDKIKADIPKLPVPGEKRIYF